MVQIVGVDPLAEPARSVGRVVVPANRPLVHTRTAAGKVEVTTRGLRGDAPPRRHALVVCVGIARRDVDARFGRERGRRRRRVARALELPCLCGERASIRRRRVLLSAPQTVCDRTAAALFDVRTRVVQTVESVGRDAIRRTRLNEVASVLLWRRCDLPKELRPLPYPLVWIVVRVVELARRVMEVFKMER